MKVKLLTLAVSFVVAFGLMETVLSQLYDRPPNWIDPQVHHEHSPLLGWVLPVDLDGAFTIDAPVRTNSFGLRDDEFPKAKPSGEQRILCLGDSFTFALGVRFEDLYVQKLERRLNKRNPPRRFQVINAGVAGYNTRQELLYLMAQGIDFDPDLITIGFYWNDLPDNDVPLPDVRTTPMRGARPNVLPEPTHTLPGWIRNPLRQNLVLYLLVTRIKGFLSQLGEPPPGSLQHLQRALMYGDPEVLAPLWQATERRLLEIAAIGRERGIPVILMAFPMENQLHLDLPRMRYVEELQRIWAPTAQPFIDLVTAYEATFAAGENPFLPYDLHPGEHGMQVAADEIYDEIVESDLLGLRLPERRAAR